MTKSREHGENEITDEAEREAARTGKHVCEVLAAMLRKAKADHDRQRKRKIIKAQKYKGCRNLRKRRKTP
jgi:hypothetical protein